VALRSEFGELATAVGTGHAVVGGLGNVCLESGDLCADLWATLRLNRIALLGHSQRLDEGAMFVTPRSLDGPNRTLFPDEGRISS
jgi:hypothetical protein